MDSARPSPYAPGMKRGFMLLIGAMLGLGSAASAVEPGYLGVWLITEARIAPWARPDHDAFDADEQRRLIGSTVIDRKTRIAALAPLGCDRPRYRTHEYPVDYLFQSGLIDPAAQATGEALILRGLGQNTGS